MRIIEPSEEIFKIIEEYKEIISKILPTAKITLIGSFAIPMCGKEEFDLFWESYTYFINNMSLRWIRNIIVDGEKLTLEIQLGSKRIGDKCFTRVNKEVESWYNVPFFDRNQVLEEGKKR